MKIKNIWNHNLDYNEIQLQIGACCWFLLLVPANGRPASFQSRPEIHKNDPWTQFSCCPEPKVPNSMVNMSVRCCVQLHLHTIVVYKKILNKKKNMFFSVCYFFMDHPICMLRSGHFVPWWCSFGHFTASHVSSRITRIRTPLPGKAGYLQLLMKTNRWNSWKPPEGPIFPQNDHGNLHKQIKILRDHLRPSHWWKLNGTSSFTSGAAGAGVGAGGADAGAAGAGAACQVHHAVWMDGSMENWEIILSKH